MASPDEIIAGLALEPHPEGGWYRETYRGAADSHGRAVGTAIYFLVTYESPSRLHRVDADEVFHHYTGASVEQLVVTADGEASLRRIGSDLAAGDEPQAVVVAGAWQGCHVPEAGGWALLGCTVSPGFEFAGFELAGAADVESLRSLAPEHATLIDRLR